MNALEEPFTEKPDLDSTKHLIDRCSNVWHDDPSSLCPPNRWQPFLQRADCWLDATVAIVRAPKFRRLLLSSLLLIFAATILWAKLLGPWFLAERAAWISLNRIVGTGDGGLFGSNSRPNFPGIVQVADLDPSLLPQRKGHKKRLIFIGDIHGCKKELERLLDKAGYDAQTDHIVSVGDIVNKGPDSLGVIDLLHANGASCVRGNHEDRLLLYAKSAKGSTLHIEESGDEAASSKTRGLKKLARQLSHQQLKYLESFPLILRIGNMGPMGDVVVVHAGLVPGLALDNQDPSSIMNMRIINLKNQVPSKKHKAKHSIPWSALWNRFQTLIPWRTKIQKPPPDADPILSKRTTVIYGHDARRGLQIGKYTKGLDSGCVRGGQLTALVVSEHGKQELIQVECQEYWAKTEAENSVDN